MTSFTVALLLCVPMLGMSADDTVSELYACSFTAHTPVGDLSGRCTTQSLPSAEYVARWAFTVSFDLQSAVAAATLQPDLFYDVVRGQCLQDGSFTNLMPLWGDFVIKPDASDYVEALRACTPVYQSAPNKITLTRVSSDPLVLQFLYEERLEDIDRETGAPSLDWITHYLNSFRRLQQNVRALQH
ncbi:MAG: hypothetical protein ACJ746_15625 [Bryobacteraceae bacterium]